MRRPLFVCLVLIAGASCLGPATAAAAVPDRGVTYAGLTSAHDPIVFTLSRDGKHLVKMNKVWDAPCTGGGSLRLGGSAKANLSVDKHGDFGGTSSEGVTLGPGRTWFLDQHFKGRVRGHALSGAWHIDMRRYDATGALAMRCRTTFTFKATAAKGRIYGGVTSQDLPVLLRIAPRAGKVRHIDFAWETDCSSGVFFQTSQRMSNLDIVHGRFGDDRGSSATTDDGEKLRLEYTVRGALSGARAAGRLGVRFTVRASSGKLIDDCNSGRLSYKVSSG